MLHVFGAGFGCTGTFSMREGLVHLGFAPCDHMLAGLSPRERDVLRLLIAAQFGDSCPFGMIHHQYLQAEASRSRIAAQAVATKKRMPMAASERLALGSALLALGSRILAPSNIAFRPAMVATGPGRWSLT